MRLFARHSKKKKKNITASSADTSQSKKSLVFSNILRFRSFSPQTILVSIESRTLLVTRWPPSYRHLRYFHFFFRSIIIRDGLERFFLIHLPQESISKRNRTEQNRIEFKCQILGVLKTTNETSEEKKRMKANTCEFSRTRKKSWEFQQHRNQTKKKQLIWVRINCIIPSFVWGFIPLNSVLYWNFFFFWNQTNSSQTWKYCLCLCLCLCVNVFVWYEMTFRLSCFFFFWYYSHFASIRDFFAAILTVGWRLD